MDENSKAHGYLNACLDLERDLVREASDVFARGDYDACRELLELIARVKVRRSARFLELFPSASKLQRNVNELASL